MPTTLPRIQVTITSEVGHALDMAEQAWPGKPRSELAAHLMVQGSKTLQEVADEKRQLRRQAIEESRGILSGVYPPDYLVELREDWPA